MTTAPLLIDILGVQAPALSMLVGLIAVVLTRVMLSLQETSTPKGWWYYNVALTLLLCVIVFVIILDRQLGPGMALIVGVGTGASGILIVDIMKKRVEGILNSITGNTKQ